MELPVKYSELHWSERKKVREQYIKLQDRKCWFCNASLDSPPPEGIIKNPIDKSLYPVDFFTHPVHLHHNHETDLTKGAVHAYCNAVLWEYEGE